MSEIYILYLYYISFICNVLAFHVKLLASKIKKCTCQWWLELQCVCRGLAPVIICPFLGSIHWCLRKRRKRIADTEWLFLENCFIMPWAVTVLCWHTICSASQQERVLSASWGFVCSLELILWNLCDVIDLPNNQWPLYNPLDVWWPWRSLMG